MRDIICSNGWEYEVLIQMVKNDTRLIFELPIKSTCDGSKKRGKCETIYSCKVYCKRNNLQVERFVKL